MDEGTLYVAIAVGLIVAVVVVAAISRLFTIDATLKAILEELRRHDSQGGVPPAHESLSISPSSR